MWLAWKVKSEVFTFLPSESNAHQIISPYVECLVLKNCEIWVGTDEAIKAGNICKLQDFGKPVNSCMQCLWQTERFGGKQLETVGVKQSLLWRETNWSYQPVPDAGKRGIMAGKVKTPESDDWRMSWREDTAVNNSGDTRGCAIRVMAPFSVSIF